MNRDTYSTSIQEAKRSLAAISATPQLDAELLLSLVINKPRSAIIAWPDHALTSSEAKTFAEYIRARSDGKPIAYLLGKQEFWSLELRVTPDTLIPRSETETLVTSLIERVPQPSTWTVADLGTGSGAIAIALAKEFPSWQIIATDQSNAALQIAQENANHLNVSNIIFKQGDWYQALEGLRLDAIVSNPPYVAAEDPELDPSVLRYEPRQAVIAESAGFAALQTLIQGAPHFLQPGGWLLLEHGWQQGEMVRKACKDAGFRQITTIPDLSGNERVTAACVI